MRAVHAHLQRTAVQGSPAVLAALTGAYVPGSARRESPVHPFRLSMAELAIGDSVTTDERQVTREDVQHFADFTGDTFYAHTDEAAAAANPLFGGIVAHGYLVLSLAAGLFVDPAPGPVLANTGLDRLRFTRPVKPGDRIHAVLTCAAKTPAQPAAGRGPLGRPGAGPPGRGGAGGRGDVRAADDGQRTAALSRVPGCAPRALPDQQEPP